MSTLKVLNDEPRVDGADSAAPTAAEPLTVDAVRAKLAGKGGPRYWRSLEELAETPQFEEMVYREFPRQASEWAAGGVDRRRFLQLMGASLSLGGLAACTTQPAEKIVPYVNQPEGLVPGEPFFFATTHTLGGYGRGVLVESHMGRPTKVEGNGEHPASLGATDVFAQASVLDLYDPDRAQAVQHLGRTTTWARFLADVGSKMTPQKALGGAGLRLLTGAVSSPALLAQIDALLTAYPQARWHVWEPAAPQGPRSGTARVFGAPREGIYDLSAADVVLSLDSDFLTSGPGAVAYARQLTGRRRDGATGEGTAIRLYSVESSPYASGTLADHRLALPPSQVRSFTAALAAELGVGGAAAGGLDDKARKWVKAVAADLSRAGSAALVVPGDYAAPEVCELAVRINQALGAEGTTVRYAEPVTVGPTDHAASLAELVRDLEDDATQVDLLVILGGNPVFTAPADLAFSEAMQKATTAVYLGSHADETAEYCHWHVPESHYLEAWGDARAWDGTPSLVQPLIQPLYEGARSALELVAALNGRTDVGGYELVREHWQKAGLGGIAGDGTGFEAAWRRALHDGVIRDEAAAAAALTAPPVAEGEAVAAAPPATGDALELVFRPDPTVWDGTWANNAWMQELPKPLTKLTWDNALHLAPADAESMALATGDLVQVKAGERTLQVAVWIVPGHAEGCATLHLGYGRRRVGRVGQGAGFDAYALRTTDALWAVPVALEKMGGRYDLAGTQDHFTMEGRHLIRHASLEEYRHEPDFAQHMTHVPAPEMTMFPEREYTGYAWGMAVDLNACTGCNACVVACQAENNIPVVGKTQVLNAREMHWIRIDRYYEGSMDDPTLHHQPVFCQHCEMAPCEVVCPVAATVHSDEGTNDMVYNRCVGTRYCSNNCPYKVRRFNFLQWVDEKTEVLKAVRNPDVTVRTRGVMEKCTYCIQRVNKARIAAKREDRKVRDGDVVTACQQACPSDALVFGDVNDPDSRVSRWKALPLNYGLLAELNTRPRTTFLAKLTNPNPALES